MTRAILIGAIVLGALGALAIRVVVEGRSALAEGDQAAAAGRTDKAIAGWETAARWYLPLAPHVDEAYARLIDLASGARPSDAAPTAERIGIGIRRGIDDTGRPSRRPALVGAALTLAGLAG